MTPHPQGLKKGSLRHLLIFSIAVYRKAVPSALRGQCLFSESCSTIVERYARDVGFTSSLRVLFFRLRHCRPGYELIARDGFFIGVLTKGNIIIAETDVAPGIRNEAVWAGFKLSQGPRTSNQNLELPKGGVNGWSRT